MNLYQNMVQEGDEYIRIKDEIDDEQKGDDYDNMDGKGNDEDEDLSDDDKVSGSYGSDDSSKREIRDSDIEQRPLGRLSL